VHERKGGEAAKPTPIYLRTLATGEEELIEATMQEQGRELTGNEKVMLDDITWRARALGGVLDDFQKNLSVNNFGELVELSNHQCELVDYLSTGKFRKAPRRRKARTLGTGGVTPESQERIEALGEALNEYQGRIEIKGLREFIALSKHQCELAGMMADYRWGGRRKNEKLDDKCVIELVHYGEAYPDAVGRSEEATELDTPVKPEYDRKEKSVEGFNPSCSDLIGASRGSICSKETTALDSPVRSGNDRQEEKGVFSLAPVGKRRRERGKCEEKRFVMSEPEGRVEKRPSTARMRGESASPGVPFFRYFWARKSI
jgi:hypothetical protein